MINTEISSDFRLYLEEAIGKENSLIAFSAFSKDSSTSIRINPFKCPTDWEKDLSLVGAYFNQDVKRIPWSKYGYILENRPSFTLDPLFHAGAYYVQDSSSMYVGEVFRKLLSTIEINSSRPIRVLDLCASPGGKTTDLSTSLREVFGDNYILVANEVIKQRATILTENVAIWGDPNIIVTSEDPAKLGEVGANFDIILADVPCSGEGMFRKDEQAISLWSKANVSHCQSRSRRILADIWPALAPNGHLIYSTCTFNKYENDENIAWLNNEFGAFPYPELPKGDGVLETLFGRLLVPGMVAGEGQYCGVVRKDGSGKKENYYKYRKPSRDSIKKIDKSIISQAKELVNNEFIFDSKTDILKALPSHIYDELAILDGRIKILSSGIAIGRIKGNILVPHPDLALSYIFSGEVYPKVELDLNMALSYLSNEALSFSSEKKSYLDLRFMGLSLGFVKNLGNRVNSLHPNNRRIRMKIK